MTRRWRAHALAATVLAAALAGSPQTVRAAETPFVAYVGEDDHPRNDLFLAPAHRQFTYSGPHDAAAEFFEVRDSRGVEGRGFTQRPNVCLLDAYTQIAHAYPTQLLPAGFSGVYSWAIALPMRPTGNIEVDLQCGVLKPNTETSTVGHPLLECAGETGERIGDPGCTRLFDQPSVNPVQSAWLPFLSARALNTAASIDFTLTAYRQPGPFTFPTDESGAMRDSVALQSLSGNASRGLMPLQACLQGNVTIKPAVTGQLNALGEEEVDLERGDLIVVSLQVPRGHSMDLYCGLPSVTLRGFGNPLTATGARRRPGLVEDE